ncbi:hypothetical protein N7540_010947 [Penicillium herquei]|nr:hypothetical protein N7540_010947 [Penicillium herquei]
MSQLFLIPLSLLYLTCQPLIDFHRLVSLADHVTHRGQGVYANILTHMTSTFREGIPRIYIGGAPGPYAPLSEGMRGQIRSHKKSSNLAKSRATVHEKLLKADNWQENWAALVIFRSPVDAELVKLAHAVMIIMFGSCQDSDYAFCRPQKMHSPPSQWGLNETGPLHCLKITTFNQLSGVSNPDDVDRIRYRQRMNALSAASSKNRQRRERISEGGPIHVTAHRSGRRIKRYFITPMTSADGGPVDISIPVNIGSKYRLEQAGTVNVTLDLSNTNHHRPYAAKSEPHSKLRCLGILITGSAPCGPRKGFFFKTWLQSFRITGCSHAEKLIEFIERRNKISCVHYADASLDSANNVPVNEEPTVTSMLTELSLPNSLPPGPLIGDDDRSNSVHNFEHMVSEVVRNIRFKVLSRQMKVCPAVSVYFANRPVDSIVMAIMSAICPPVVHILTSHDEITAFR